MSIIIVP